MESFGPAFEFRLNSGQSISSSSGWLLDDTCSAEEEEEESLVSPL